MTSFDEIRQQCLETKELWKDPDFPAQASSLYYYQATPVEFEWRRPQVKLRARNPRDVTSA